MKVTIKQLFDSLINELIKSENVGVNNVMKAFNVADELHKGQVRKSGEPYIFHPLRVAKCLQELDFDTDVICAALLHDIVEDCDYTIVDIENNFNPNIARIVDAVTALTKGEGDIENIFENPEFSKQSQEDQTFKKLIAIGKENKFAFIIKFADRLDNLKTIEVFDEYKQLEKVKETQKWVIPLAYLMRTRYFYENLQDECFKIINRHKIGEFEQRYKYYQSGNIKAYNDVKAALGSIVQSYCLRNKIAVDLKKCILVKETLHGTYEQIKKTLDISKFKMIKRNSLNKIASAKLYLIFNGKYSPAEFNNLFFNLLEEKPFERLFSITGFELDEVYNLRYFIVKDRHRIKYRLVLLTQEQFLLMRNGTSEGTDIDLIDEKNVNEIVKNYITVKTRSGKTVKMPEGSTVLDFAIKLHSDLGLSAKYAIINKSPTKFSLYTKISDGEQIEIINEVDQKTGLNVPLVQIRWLAYVNTDYAKKVLIRYLEKHYDIKELK